MSSPEIEKLKLQIEKLTEDNVLLNQKLNTLEKTVKSLTKNNGEDEDPIIPFCPIENCEKMLHRVKFYKDEKIIESDYYCIEHGHQIPNDPSLLKINENEISGNDETKIKEEN